MDYPPNNNRKLIAVHEAAHAIVSMHYGFEIAEVSLRREQIDENRMREGHVLFTGVKRQSEVAYWSRTDEQRLRADAFEDSVCLLAGDAAEFIYKNMEVGGTEELIRGDYSDGGREAFRQR